MTGERICPSNSWNKILIVIKYIKGFSMSRKIKANCGLCDRVGPWSPNIPYPPRHFLGASFSVRLGLMTSFGQCTLSRYDIDHWAKVIKNQCAFLQPN